jgi:hypothetical protein
LEVRFEDPQIPLGDVAVKKSLEGLLACVVLCAGPVLLAQGVPGQAPAGGWKPFQEFAPLLGSWSGTADSGGRIGGQVVRFALEMNGNYMTSRGRTIFAAQGEAAEESLEETGTFFYDRERRKYVAHYYFSTGVIGFYDVEFLPDGAVRLLSTQLLNSEAGARSRITFTKKAETELGLGFELAPAGKDYSAYITGKLTKK